MSESMGVIYYEVDADTGKLVNSTGAVDKSLDGLQRGFDRTDAKASRFNGRMSKLADGVKRANAGLRNVNVSLSSFQALLAAVGVGAALKAIVGASDSLTDMRSQLRLVTESQQELNETFEATYRLAQETRGSLDSTISLYARLRRSTDGLGLSNENLLTITKAINQSFVVSGASAEESAGAIRQLSQGLASGTLRGDELNSVLENSPRLARAISEGLGVTIGQLRQLGADGQITGAAITKALLQTADEIDREFQSMPRTVGQALQQLKNDFIVTFGETDVTPLVESIDKLRELITDPQFQQGMIDTASAFVRIAGAVAGSAADIANFTRWLGEEVASRIGGISGDDAVRIGQRVAAVTEEITGKEAELQALRDKGFKRYGSDANRAARLEMDLLELRQEREQLVQQETAAIEAQTKAIEEQRKKENQRRSSGSAGGVATQDQADGPEAAKRLERMREEVAILREVGIERLKLQAVMKLGEDASERQRIAAKKLADELYRLNDMDEARQQIKALGEQLSVASLRGEELAVQQARLQLGEYVDPSQIKMVEDLARALYRANNSLSLLTQVDPIANEEARYQQELEDLRALNEAKILEDQRYLDLKAQAEKRYMENMRQLQEQNFRAQNEWNEILMATLDHVQQASTDAITGLLSGINNTREAMQMLAKAILREVVGAFVEMGISQVKAWVMGQAAQTAAGAAYAAAVSGQVAANTALAAQAAYASTAAIPVVGPFLAPAAAARAGVEAASIGAPAITAATASAAAGGRQYGGPVAAGSMYRVNEDGRPEVFKASNGQQFMIPNSRGEVISNSDAAGGGAATVVNLNIVESQDRGGEVERMDGPNGDVTITAFVADIRRDGPASRALSQTFGLKRRGK